MKKNLGILSLALLAGITLVSCGEKPQPTPNTQGETTDSQKNMGSVIKSKQDVYAYSMFSSSTLLDNLSAPATMGVAALTEADKQAEIDKVDEYVNMFNGLLEKKGINQKTEENTDAEFKDYKTKMTVVQNGKTYVSYLNETAKNEADKGKEDSEEVEVETKLDGLMFEMDAENNPVASYIIKGNKEIEKENEEGSSEEELSISMTSFLAVKNAETGVYEVVKDAKTVTVKQEFETEVKEDGTIEKEQSFKYTVKDKDGKKINNECSKVEIEEENGETEIKLQVGAEQGKKMYKFKKVGDVLDVKVVEGKQQPTLQITITFVKDAEGNVIDTKYEFKDCNKKEEKVEENTQQA